MDIWLEAERQLQTGFVARPVAQDEIPADPANPDPDHDPALSPEEDREIESIGGQSEQRSPTSL